MFHLRSGISFYLSYMESLCQIPWSKRSACRGHWHLKRLPQKKEFYHVTQAYYILKITTK